MNTVKNPLYILEAAKSIVAKEQQLTKENPKDPKLSLVNEEIVRIKEIIEKTKVDKSSSNIETFIQSCREKGLLDEVTLKSVNSVGQLLDLLQARRKSLKENSTTASMSSTNSKYGSISYELFLSSFQYTIRALCDEFSCSDKIITPGFVESKKSLCCSKLRYLLSQYDHCDELARSIEDFNSRFNITYSKDDIPKVDHMANLSFDIISSKAIQITYSEYPDFELNRKLLGSLSHFRESIVKEIDNYCNKIDLANSFLKSMEKTTHIAFN